MRFSRILTALQHDSKQINQQDRRGRTALHYVAHLGHLEMLPVQDPPLLGTLVIFDLFSALRSSQLLLGRINPP